MGSIAGQPPPPRSTTRPPRRPPVALCRRLPYSCCSLCDVRYEWGKRHRVKVYATVIACVAHAPRRTRASISTSVPEHCVCEFENFPGLISILFLSYKFGRPIAKHLLITTSRIPWKLADKFDDLSPTQLRGTTTDSSAHKVLVSNKLLTSLAMLQLCE